MRVHIEPGDPLPESVQAARVSDTADHFARSFEHAELPLYGLSNWAGAVAIDGYGTSYVDDDPVPTYRLIHTEEPRVTERPLPRTFVVVSTTMPTPLLDGNLPWELVVGAEGVRPTEFDFELESLREPLPGATQGSVDVDVDGARVAFDLLERGDAFAATGRVGFVALVMVGRGVDFRDLVVARVRDLAPYVEGYRRYIAVWQRNGWR